MTDRSPVSDVHFRAMAGYHVAAIRYGTGAVDAKALQQAEAEALYAIRSYVSDHMQGEIEAANASRERGDGDAYSLWWVLHGHDLRDALYRAHDGERPDLLLTELYANTTGEEVQGDV